MARASSVNALARAEPRWDLGREFVMAAAKVLTKAWPDAIRVADRRRLRGLLHWAVAGDLDGRSFGSRPRSSPVVAASMVRNALAEPLGRVPPTG
jgi:hypothetical protein